MAPAKFRVAKPLEAPKDYDRGSSYDWHETLESEDANIVPVNNFSQAPLHSIFHHILPELKVEVPNRDHFQAAKSIGGVYWVARVVRVAGYRALVRYEGAEDATYDFWMNLGGADIHPVGWCAGQGKPLVPPKFLTDKQEDWKGFLVKALTGSRTFPPDWQEKVKKSLGDNPFKVGMRLETVDRDKPERIRAAKVVQVIAHRMQLEYSASDQPAAKPKRKKKDEEDQEDEENELGELGWLHKSSPIIFPVGWATRVGYELHASPAYKKHCDAIAEADPDGSGEGPYDKMDAKPKIFTMEPKSEFHGLKDKKAGDPADKVKANLDAAKNELCQWEKGMKLEVLDLVTNNTFLVATVNRVLKGGEYLEIAIDDDEKTPDLLPYHRRSPYLFPIGFCNSNGLKLEVPKGSKDGVEFDWSAYLEQTQSKAAPVLFFDEDKYDSSAFQVGSQLEAVDMNEPKLVCPATIIAKKGSRLLQIRFHGWEAEFDQFQDFRSPDIFPVGWAELCGYKLEKPAKSEKEAEEAEEKSSPTKRKHSEGESSKAKKSKGD